MVKPAVVVDFSIRKIVERYARPLGGLPRRDPTSIGGNAISGQCEASCGNARDLEMVLALLRCVPVRPRAVERQSGVRIRVFPKVSECALLKILQEGLIAFGDDVVLSVPIRGRRSCFRSLRKGRGD